MLDNSLKCTNCDGPINANLDSDWTMELVGHLKPDTTYEERVMPVTQYFCHPICLFQFFAGYVVEHLTRVARERHILKEPNGDPHGPH